MKFTFVPAYSFGTGWKASMGVDSFNTPGPGTYNSIDLSVYKPSTGNRRIGLGLRTETKPNNFPAPNKYDIKDEISNLSTKPKHGGYSFGKSSNVKPKTRPADEQLLQSINNLKKKNKKNKKKQKENNNNSADNMFKEKKIEADEAAIPENIEKGYYEDKNYNKKNKKDDDKKGKTSINFYNRNKINDEDLKYIQLDGTAPGVGRYNIRSSVKVPVAKFGTERKDIAYQSPVSPGPSKYNLREEPGKDTIKVGFGTSARDEIKRPKTPGPGSYKIETNLGDDNAPKYSFGKEIRMGNIKNNNNKKKKIKKLEQFYPQPGPADYDTRTKFGSDARHITISPNGRRPYIYNNFPAPNAYLPNYKVIKKHYPSYRIGTAKRRDLYEVEKYFPAPNKYTIKDNYNSKRPKSPSWKIGTGKRPKLYYTNNSPGVGMYTLRSNKISGPKYTLRSKYKIVDSKMQVPGVGMYNIDNNKLLLREPAWKIGSSIREDTLRRIKRENFPGPGMYQPIIKRRHSGNIKFGKEKRNTYKINDTPGPKYKIPCSIVDINDYTRQQGKWEQTFKYI
jgi:hypothetical protein